MSVERSVVVLALIVWLPLIILLGALAYYEYTAGQRYSRLLFDDIVASYPDGTKTRWVGVMTTLSYSALLVAGVCAGLISFSCSQVPRTARGKVFWGAAASLFVLAALDDRFVFHEDLGTLLRVNDALLVLLYPAAFLALAVWGRSELLRFRRHGWLLFLIAVALLTSIGVDYVYIWDAHYPYVTLIEDGTKVFASLSLFLFTLECLLDQLRLLHRTHAS